MKAKSIFALLFFLSALGPYAARAGGKDPCMLPAEALKLLSRSASESCPSCARKMREKAFAIIGGFFVPGDRLESGPDRPFLRSEECGENELTLRCHRAEPSGESQPVEIVFSFHTEKLHLAGISPKDFTKEPLAEMVNTAPCRAAFSGGLEIIAFDYGDGPFFHFDTKARRLYIHCKVGELKPVLVPDKIM